MSVQNALRSPSKNPGVARPLRLLLTGGGGAGTEAMWSLLSRTYDVWIADADRNQIHPAVPRDRARSIPFAGDSGFVDAIVDLCRMESIDVLVPGVDEELLALSRSAEALLPTQVMIPPTEFIETMLDKWLFFEALQASDIATPLTVKLDQCDDWDDFPLIVKPRHGRGSRGVSVIDNRDGLMHCRGALGIRASDYVVQQKLDGVEFTVQVFSNREGDLKAVIPARIALKRGVTISCETDPVPAVIALCEAIHSRFEVSGCYNVQGMLGDTGTFVPFEINPRVSTTLCLSVAAGIDPIAAFLGGPDNSAPARVETTWKLERFWTNYIHSVEDEA